MSAVDQAMAWISQDPDPQTRSELQALVAKGQLEELEKRFSSRLEFGTAGLRGELGAGPSRMNQVVVAQTALGIARFLAKHRSDYLDANGELSVVIGYDGRINSDVFAKLSAEIFAASGIHALLYDQRVPTPVAAYTGRRLRSSATVVVTASHNPPRDNGYKVYLGGANGNSQLVPPQDAQIAAEINEIAKTKTFSDIERSNSYQLIGDVEIQHYVNRAVELVPITPQDLERRGKLKIVHTSMHGVGWKFVKQIFEGVGFSLHSVLEQQEPDGTFPTVSFPNPEEPGAMDMASSLAKVVGADLVLANDPDADRLAVGLGPEATMLTGDQVGMILAERAASRGAKVIANSIVSQDLSPIAQHYGIDYQQTLTGFKWISKVPGIDYGYEEALGYCVDPEYTPDKDGITAALVFAELASVLQSEGKDVSGLISELAQRYGETATGQVSIRVSDLEIIGKVMAGIRNAPPHKILGQPVSLDDYLDRPGTKRTDALVFASPELKVIFRPSGTEPKLKCYLQYRGNDAKSGLAELTHWAKELIASFS